MSMKWKMKYSAAAVIAALAIISISLVANPTLLPRTVKAAPFAVMLTDPPVVPEGTTLLNLNYSKISLHVTYPDEKVEWLPVEAEGTVDLLSLINMSKTIASITLPVGSAVDKIQFTITDVDAVVKGTLYNVTTLSDTLLIKVVHGQINETASGVLIDFNPTLVQIGAVDANGISVHYYVLVPSATAAVVGNLSEDQTMVGTTVKLHEDDFEELEEADEESSSNVKIEDASLSVSGDVTSLSVTLKNEGTSDARVFGLTVKGDFGLTATEHDDEDDLVTIPFKVDGSALVPVFGSEHEHDDELGEHQTGDSQGNNAGLAFLTIKPGDSITLTFSGVIAFHPEDDGTANPTVLTPKLGADYTLKTMGEGSQTFTLKAA